jgi:hypothetical protein
MKFIRSVAFRIRLRVPLYTEIYYLVAVKPQPDDSVVDHGDGSFTVPRCLPPQFDMVRRQPLYGPVTASDFWEGVECWSKTHRPDQEV